MQGAYGQDPEEDLYCEVKKNPSSTGYSFNIDCFKVFHEKEANADLAALSYRIDGGTITAIDGFDPAQTDYEVLLPIHTSGTIELIAEAAGEHTDPADRWRSDITGRGHCGKR